MGLVMDGVGGGLRSGTIKLFVVVNSKLQRIFRCLCGLTTTLRRTRDCRDLLCG